MHKGQLALPSGLCLSRFPHAGAPSTRIRSGRALSWLKAHILSRHDVRSRVLGGLHTTTSGVRMRDDHISTLLDGWEYSARTGRALRSFRDWCGA